MPIEPARKNEPSSSPVLFPGLSRRNAREAAALFLLASAFAILFNAFYADGIELKFKPKHLTVPHPSLDPEGYPGWNNGTFKDRTSPEKQDGKNGPKIPRSLKTSDNIPRLSLQGTYQRFIKGTSIFLDARKPEEYAEGHIPGALEFYGNDLDSFAPKVLPQLPDKDQEIVSYCHGGDCDLSLQVAKTLREQGYTRVEIFQDGWPGWKKAGYPVQAGEKP